ncbi:MAG: D-alanyl-D-alanine carboxypeptidase/D-alanyl-D-alanine-endopeptidase [Bacteroidales bacterium]
MKLIILIYISFFISILNTNAQSFSNLDNNDIFKSSLVAYKVVETKTGKTVYKKNNQLALSPASVNKIISSATALEILGKDYTFKTQFGISEEVGNKLGILVGDLIIKGGGDPTLCSERFGNCSIESLLDSVYQQLDRLEINTIAGDIIIDLSIYDNMPTPSKWTWEDMGNYYGAGSYALSVCENTYKVHLFSPTTANKKTEILNISPEIIDINNFENHVTSSDNKSDNAYIYGSHLANKREIFGTIPKGKTDFSIKGSIGNPPIFFGEQLKSHLLKRGINILGKPKVAKDTTPVIKKIIYTHESPNLAYIVKELNYTSSNLIAEHLIKQIAYEKEGLGSTTTGIELVLQYWRQNGLDPNYLSMFDGSGLSRFNAISPDFFVDILQYMRNKSKCSRAFINSLPDGKKLGFSNTPEGRILAKSGTLSGVRCYGGYYKGASGKTYTFTFLVNNFKCPYATVRREIEKALNSLN